MSPNYFSGSGLGLCYVPYSTTDVPKILFFNKNRCFTLVHNRGPTKTCIKPAPYLH